jgi:3-oxo-5alpha-steroid 4-dehydrogenase
VPFEGSLCPYKTSYPNDDYYLYYSGSEAAGGFREAAKPAALGHRAKGPGTSGKLLFARLAATVRREGVRVMPQTTVLRLVSDAAGSVVGLRARTLRDAPGGCGPRTGCSGATRPSPGCMSRPFARLSTGGRYPWNADTLGKSRSPRAAGRAFRRGFIANRAMVREHAPAYRGGLALGGTGPDFGLAIFHPAERVSPWNPG